MPSPAPLGPRARLTLRSPEGPEGAGGLALAPGAWPGHSQAGAPGPRAAAGAQGTAAEERSPHPPGLSLLSCKQS